MRIRISACPLTNTIMQLPYDVSGMEWNGCVFTHPAARARYTQPFHSLSGTEADKILFALAIVNHCHERHIHDMSMRTLCPWALLPRAGQLWRIVADAHSAAAVGEGHRVAQVEPVAAHAALRLKKEGIANAERFNGSSFGRPRIGSSTSLNICHVNSAQFCRQRNQKSTKCSVIDSS